MCFFGSTGDGYCVWLFHIKQKYFVQQHSFLCSNIQHSTFPHQPKAGGPLTADRPTMHRKFLRISDVRELWAMKRILSLHSREGNVLHAFLLYTLDFGIADGSKFSLISIKYAQSCHRYRGNLPFVGSSEYRNT